MRMCDDYENVFFSISLVVIGPRGTWRKCQSSLLHLYLAEVLETSGFKYRQYHIGFCGTRYDINPILSADVGVNIFDITDFAEINVRYWKLLANVDGKKL